MAMFGSDLLGEASGHTMTVKAMSSEWDKEVTVRAFPRALWFEFRVKGVLGNGVERAVKSGVGCGGIRIDRARCMCCVIGNVMMRAAVTHQ